jgi:hypothetical protein
MMLHKKTLSVMYHVEAEHDAPAKLLEDSYVHPYLSKLVYIRVYHGSDYTFIPIYPSSYIYE